VHRALLVLHVREHGASARPARGPLRDTPPLSADAPGDMAARGRERLRVPLVQEPQQRLPGGVLVYRGQKRPPACAVVSGGAAGPPNWSRRCAGPRGSAPVPILDSSTGTGPRSETGR